MSETVVINRLYHRELIARMTEIEELEKKWNCKIDFPNTEQASDVITISGPEYQVPQALDAFLVGQVMSVNGRDPFSLTVTLRAWSQKSTKSLSKIPKNCPYFSTLPIFTTTFVKN